MPLNLDLYRTTVMLEAIRLTPIKYTFLRDTFFPVYKEFITEDCLVDLKRKNRLMAPIVGRRRRGQVVERYPYKTFRVEPPFIAPVRTLTLEDLEKRVPGEGLFDPLTIEERQMEMLADDTAELFEMVDRREEWMCAQVLTTGKIIAPSDDPLEQYEFSVDYGFTQNVTVTGTAAWSNYTTSNPFLDLSNAIDTVSANSTVIPDCAILNPFTWRWFVASQQVQRTLFARSISIGEVRPEEQQGPGVRLVGRLTDPPIDLYTYNEWFADPTNNYVNTKLVPDWKVIVLLREGNMNRIYGSAVKQMDPETTQFKTYAARRVPRVWADVQDQVRKYSITSKTLPAPVDVTQWVVLTVGPT
jgi:Phage major capsid protein E